MRVAHAHEFSDEEDRLLLALFKMFDKDRSGGISLDEALESERIVCSGIGLSFEQSETLAEFRRHDEEANKHARGRVRKCMIASIPSTQTLISLRPLPICTSRRRSGGCSPTSRLSR